MKVYIFSYNRGPYLLNSVMSAMRNIADADICVIDDGSDDSETVRILEELSSKVIVKHMSKADDTRYGGLYKNIQFVLDNSDDEIILCTQDDAQVVRPFSEDDVQYINGYFSSFPDAAFLNPAFPLMNRKSGIRKALKLDGLFPVYFYSFSEFFKDRSVTMYYTDIFVGHVGRLRRERWFSDGNETENAKRARSKFSKMGAMAYPFISQLPEVPSFGGKNNTFSLRFISFLHRHGPCFFHDMSDEDALMFKSRDLSVIPYAEDWLKCDSKKPPVRPFKHKMISVHPILKFFHKLELFVYRFFRGGKR